MENQKEGKKSNQIKKKGMNSIHNNTITNTSCKRQMKLRKNGKGSEDFRQQN